MIKCVIIDDEPLASDLLESYVDMEPALNLLCKFNDPKSARKFILENQVDLLFLDIQMPHVTGIQLLKSLTHPPMVIFTTGYDQFATQGFDLDAIDYLLKPFDLERFKKAIKKASDYQNHLSKPIKTDFQYLFIRSEYKVIKINYTDITYIEGLDDYLKIHTTNSRPILTIMTLKAMAEKLPQDRFSRVHRSYIVAIDKIEVVENKRIKMKDISIPIGKIYGDHIANLFRERGLS